MLLTMIRVRIDCTYPGTALPPTRVTFRPVGLGEDAAEVGARLQALLAGEYFEVAALGEPMPLPFYSETVQQSSPEGGEGSCSDHAAKCHTL